MLLDQLDVPIKDVVKQIDRLFACGIYNQLLKHDEVWHLFESKPSDIVHVVQELARQVFTELLVAVL